MQPIKNITHNKGRNFFIAACFKNVLSGLGLKQSYRIAESSWMDGCLYIFTLLSRLKFEENVFAKNAILCNVKCSDCNKKIGNG